MGEKHEDERLETLLRSLPDQPDTRTPDEVLKRLQSDSRLSGEPSLGQAGIRQRKRRMVPLLAASAALLAGAIVIPSVLDGEKSTDQSAEQSTATVDHDKEESEEAAGQPPAAESRILLNDSAEAGRYALYSLDGGSVLNGRLPSAQSADIPVSVVFNADQLRAKGLPADAPEQQLAAAFSSDLALEAMGLPAFRPVGSAAAYKGASAPYFVCTGQDGRQFLAPYTDRQAETFVEAAEMMRTAPDDAFTSAIPAGASFTVRQDGSTAVLTFDPAIQLEGLGPDRGMQLIDSLALTARSFGVGLRLEGISPADWNGLDFRKTLPEAIGPNPQPAILKND
ncbi:hypothetical protein NCCP2716_04200 [Sporosarcina sp. NCCP-2716]|uniref:hypothetical protein n=1 Tax=Sporosarcina sp. NCCP-2716 TaxID=2943679 RepID=UPI00203C1E4B|nr:hypothetical protein [Sporosarcina sp. NCCP-2716]GKV67922.1 hypothetical protein NCCP2716_04200 [Sporosarcina sp. NCCP-2716]